MISEDSATLSLRELQQELIQSLPERFERISELRRRLESGDRQESTLRELHRIVHAIRGETATFGFQKLAVITAEIEGLLKRLMEHPGEPLVDQIGSQFDSLELTAQLYDNSLPALPEALGEVAATQATERPHVYLVDDDTELADTIAQQLRQYGFEISIFSDLGGVGPALERERPAALVLDVTLPEGELAGTEYVVRMRRSKLRVPAIFISTRNDMEARLQACRAGGDGFFTKPPDFGLLAERLDQLTGRRPDRPYEILIVDDDVPLARYHAEALRRAGMWATVVNDPLRVLEQLARSRPDLILLDLYMPGCDGLELAMVLRQHESFLSIPIVFLSTEDDIDQHLRALSLGGDEFLTKPIQPTHLVATVRPRAARGRLLGSRLHRDGLTGLMNHSRQKEQLEIELIRAEREDSPLVFAMLDLDSFKSINDTYGHAAGDRVLCSLASILKKRLRRTDLIARYGGDEFAVVLPNTSPTDAVSIFEQITENFASLLHFAGDQRFTVTMSCGVATHASPETLQQLSEAADRALYKAKRAGRNRVVLAS